VFIHLDPRRSGVSVPARLRSQAQVVLQVGLDMPVPIPDLRIDHEGVFGTLSFRGVPFACFVPWGSVFALVGEDAKGMVWHADMPEEIAAEVEREGRKRVEEEGGAAELVELEAFRAARAEASRPEVGRMDLRRSGAVPKRKSDRPPAWDRPAYLRVVK
jgi:stringent starvation protein B